MVRIETERLIIRDNIESDLDDHHRLISDQEIMSYLSDIHTHSLEESKKNLKFSIEESQKKDARSCYFFAMIDKKDNTYIGAIGLTLLDQNETGGNAELGYFILKEFWNKGYTTEAAKAVISFGFNKLKIHKITTGCTLENTRSEHIMKKLGMEKEAHLKKHICHNNEWKDRVEYALFKE